MNVKSVLDKAATEAIVLSLGSLSGGLLDAMVAHLDNRDFVVIRGAVHDKFYIENSCDGETRLNFSQSWDLAGKIIDREGISILNLDAHSWDVSGWMASKGELWSPSDDGIVSETALIAAMRAFVESKLGVNVVIPEEIAKMFKLKRV